MASRIHLRDGYGVQLMDFSSSGHRSTVFSFGAKVGKENSSKRSEFYSSCPTTIWPKNHEPAKSSRSRTCRKSPYPQSSFCPATETWPRAGKGVSNQWGEARFTPRGDSRVNRTVNDFLSNCPTSVRGQRKEEIYEATGSYQQRDHYPEAHVGSILKKRNWWADMVTVSRLSTDKSLAKSPACGQPWDWLLKLEIEIKKEVNPMARLYVGQVKRRAMRQDSPLEVGLGC